MSEGKSTVQGWDLKLYVVGQSPSSRRAERNIEKIREKYLDDTCTIEIINLLEDPQRAEDDRILITPTLVRQSPLPVRKIIGDLSNFSKVISGLEILEDRE